MADVCVLGVTHYPPLSMPDEDMADILRITLRDPGIPETEKSPDAWPKMMRDEWGDDGGATAAGVHRAALVDGLRRVRAALDQFQPDVVLIWGDDQHENFQDDLIPAYAVLCYPDLEIRPWADAAESAMVRDRPNVWNEPPDTVRIVRGAPDAARWLVEQLLCADFDVAYAYRPLHHPGFAHSFLNTVLYLDYDRAGFNYPVIAMPVNCYGRRVISAKGFITSMADQWHPDPPSPSPERIYNLGRTIGRAVANSELRVACIASSSWSHAFLCDATWRLRPDVDADRRLYDALVAGDHATWTALTLDDIEAAGQQELLNWFAGIGVVDELGLSLSWSEFVETNCFNSDKVFAVWM